MGQWYCVVQGQQYGPVDEAAVRQWIQEGRLLPTDNVWCEGMAEWQPASQVSGLAGVFGSQTPSADASIPPESQPPRAADISSVYDAPSQAQDPIDMLANSTAQPGVTTKRRPSVPHRGGTILTLGILGLVCCGICGICAWVMGSGDMKQINAGVMDPSGKGVTQAGKILGIIGTILWILGVVIRVGVLAATS